MMMNRDRLGFWVRIVAIGLAVIFVGSSVFFGIGMTGTGYNLFDLLGGSQNQQQQSSAAPDPGAQIEEAEKELRENPNDPDAIEDLAAAYYTNGRYDDAARVLEEGQRKAPEDEDIPALLGSVRLQQAQTAPEKEQKGLYKEAGDAFAAATEADPENEQAFYAAGQSYDQAGEPAEAIKYYNGYLELEPDGEQAKEVEGRISALLEGGEGTTAGG